jgi:cellulose synthase/poly-beta-1,6-N-acetylglucosamine synthase-like glycosyltransferase
MDFDGCFPSCFEKDRKQKFVSLYRSKGGTVKMLTDLIGFLYLLVILGLALYGLYDLLTTVLYLRTKSPLKRGKAVPLPKHWPPVTIQLPIYNEKYMVDRLLYAVTHLDYPNGLLQIQVLDDSTDDTVEVVSRLVEEYKAHGVNIEWTHRTNRKGYKAGALDEGLHGATGELIGIFDADFVPKPDWLKKTVPLFRNRKLGCLQTRWGHTNRKYNSLTRAEAMGIDGHFIVEQTVRSSNDFFLNFNGTAGLWRRACIEDAGGWQLDTLNEDHDLSYRAQMRGWKIGYLPDVIVPAELPAQVEAFKKQQFRWAKGSFQVVRKILPKVFEQPGLSWKVRVMALLHLTGYFVHPLMLSLLLLTLPVGMLIPGAFKVFPLSIIAGFGPPLLYVAAAAPQTPPLRERLRLLPLLVIMGFGISLSTSIAVLQGLSGKGGVFIRTPKLNLSNDPGSRKPVDRTYVPPVSRLIWAEIALGLYALTTILMLYRHVGWGIVPWMTIYVIGYFYIAGLNLIQHVPRGNGRITKSVAG